MELTSAHAMQGLMLVATIAGGYAVVSSTAVFQHQITILGHILSPAALEKSHREIADLMARVKVAENRIDRNASMHNGKHPHIKE